MPGYSAINQDERGAPRRSASRVPQGPQAGRRGTEPAGTDTRLLVERLSGQIPAGQIIRDILRRIAYASNASFYRLTPKVVVRVESEQQVVAVLRECRKLRLPVTFRGAGTSLSGQAISDSVLLQLGANWRRIRVLDGGARVRLQSGVIGSQANSVLLPYGRKIGPDPASINACTIGGIAANNASGMCCGVASNSYRTLASSRIIFVDGSLLDTASAESRAQFAAAHPEMTGGIAQLARRTRNNSALRERIRRKYETKNTVGYGLNSLVDFDDPIDIIEHLMIGSEGTLGFLSEITFHTVPELPCKATALMLFTDIRTACDATVRLKRCRVSAVEIMDRSSLRSVENKAGMPAYLKMQDAGVAGLLVETRADTSLQLGERVAEALEAIRGLPAALPVSFTDREEEYTALWNIRKGLLPSVGAVRPDGTAVIIEDVVFPMEFLAEATLDLQALFGKHGYPDAIIFGHALEGNLHFVIAQSFSTEREVSRYGAFMEELAHLVVDKHHGSLKGEHSTGRNMAPFVELEWGAEAYGLMMEIKHIFDPDNLLNPGVILNADPEAHLHDTQALPESNPLVDKCMECGFCEPHCPSQHLTLTPRQRIAVWREISRLSATGESPALLDELKRDYAYQGEQTCATDGLCATACPVEIDTGKLIKELRSLQVSRFSNRLADWVADNFGVTVSLMRAGLNTVDALHRALGTPVMTLLADFMRKLSGGRLPAWNRCMPRGGQRIRQTPVCRDNPLKAVYFPSCVSRLMGTATRSKEREAQTAVIDRLLRKAGYEVIYPARMPELCCGMAFNSKGFTRQAERKLRELHEALLAASESGRYPVLIDTSPCNYRIQEALGRGSGLALYEPAEFICRFLKDRLVFRRKAGTVALHVPCSSRKMGLEPALKEVALLCAERVVIPPLVECCGWAGDRGFHYPELTASALATLESSLSADCEEGYSTSRACEIGLSLHAAIPYRSLAYLVHECTESPAASPPPPPGGAGRMPEALGRLQKKEVFERRQRDPAL